MILGGLTTRNQKKELLTECTNLPTNPKHTNRIIWHKQSPLDHAICTLYLLNAIFTLCFQWPQQSRFKPQWRKRDETMLGTG